MNKYEKLIEYIISDQEDLARELFHEIVVEKSRNIYESLIENDPEMEGGMGGMGKVDELMHDVEADESVAEADDDMGDMDLDAEESDMPDLGDEGDMPDMGDEGDMPEMGDEEGMGDEDLEDRVMDLESALDELKAEFDKLMAGEEESGDEESGDEESEADEEEGDEEMVREYVEKVAAPANSEGHEVGAGKSAAVQKKSPGLQNSNDMGGQAFHLGKGAEAAPDGQRPTGKAGGFLKPAQEIDVAKKNVNKVGGNKGAQDFYGTKAKAKTGEEGGVNKKSIESGN